MVNSQKNYRLLIFHKRRINCPLLLLLLLLLVSYVFKRFLFCFVVQQKEIFLSAKKQKINKIKANKTKSLTLKFKRKYKL